MKKISTIFIIVVISIFFSCSDNDDKTQTPNPNENGFMFNSEFFTTDELFLGGNTVSPTFTIIDDTSEFNTITREFEGNPGQVIVIGVIVKIDRQEDFVRTFTDAIQEFDNPDDVVVENSFAAALIGNVQTAEPILSGGISITNNETLFLARTGEVTISFDSETQIFTLDYTFTTDNGEVVNGFHESEFIPLND